MTLRTVVKPVLFATTTLALLGGCAGNDEKFGGTR